MDVDIDTRTDFVPTDIFDIAINASQVKDGQLKKHPAGTYFQSIPVDSMTDLSAIPYNKAEDFGYFKIDFLHLSILDYFESKKEIQALIKKTPDWNLLLQPSVVVKLFQVHQHSDLLYRVKPRSVIELADCLALIRPSKRNMLESYLKDKKMVSKHLYTEPTSGGYYFKKGHAISYALTIILQLHLIKADIL